MRSVGPGGCETWIEAQRKELRPFVESHYPILHVVTFEDEQWDQVIRELADGRVILEWNLALGRVDFETKRTLARYLNLPDALSSFLNQDDLGNHFIVIRDAHLVLPKCPEAISRLRTLAGRIVHDNDTKATIFLISSRAYVAPELAPFVTVFHQEPPEDDEIERLIERHAGIHGYKVEEAIVNDLVVACRGLSGYEITRLLNRGYQRDSVVGADDVDLVIEEKKQIVKKSGALEMVSATAEIDQVGGLKGLKAWLDQKAKVMHDLAEARRFGVETPKGMIIVGMSGCGKSLTAKATSALFGLPLLRLDVGTLMGRYVGESEANMRDALRLAETVSPCVLWVDEIEKAFTGIGGSDSAGSQITSRLFGYFLTWMQEKTKPVFVVATANDISVLPPELLRKGRFDEAFYVDFPDKEERAEILQVHYEKRQRDIKEIDLTALSAKTDGFSGADLEGVVKDAIERAFVDDKRKVAMEDLLHAIESNRRHANMMKDEAKKLRDQYEKKRIRNASKVMSSDSEANKRDSHTAQILSPLVMPKP